MPLYMNTLHDDTPEADCNNLVTSHADLRLLSRPITILFLARKCAYGLEAGRRCQNMQTRIC